MTRPPCVNASGDSIQWGAISDVSLSQSLKRRIPSTKCDEEIRTENTISPRVPDYEGNKHGDNLSRPSVVHAIAVQDMNACLDGSGEISWVPAAEGTLEKGEVHSDLGLQRVSRDTTNTSVRPMHSCPARESPVQYIATNDETRTHEFLTPCSSIFAALPDVVAGAMIPPSPRGSSSVRTANTSPILPRVAFKLRLSNPQLCMGCVSSDSLQHFKSAPLISIPPANIPRDTLELPLTLSSLANPNPKISVSIPEVGDQHRLSSSRSGTFGRRNGSADSSGGISIYTPAVSRRVSEEEEAVPVPRLYNRGRPRSFIASPVPWDPVDDPRLQSKELYCLMHVLKSQTSTPKHLSTNGTRLGDPSERLREPAEEKLTLFACTILALLFLRAGSRLLCATQDAWMRVARDLSVTITWETYGSGTLSPVAVGIHFFSLRDDQKVGSRRDYDDVKEQLPEEYRVGEQPFTYRLFRLRIIGLCHKNEYFVFCRETLCQSLIAELCNIVATVESSGTHSNATSSGDAEVFKLALKSWRAGCSNCSSVSLKVPHPKPKKSFEHRERGSGVDAHFYFLSGGGYEHEDYFIPNEPLWGPKPTLGERCMGTAQVPLVNYQCLSCSRGRMALMPDMNESPTEPTTSTTYTPEVESTSNGVVAPTQDQSECGLVFINDTCTTQITADGGCCGASDDIDMLSVGDLPEDCLWKADSNTCTPYAGAYFLF